MIHLYTICWNEERMLPFFFRHYDQWVDRYVVYDDNSTDATLEKILRTIVSHVKKSKRNCVLHDHLKKRYSEVGYLNGLVVRKGREVGIPTPANEAITEVTRKIQLGELQPDRSNLALVQQMLR